MVGIAKKCTVGAGIEEGIHFAHGRRHTGGIFGSTSLGVRRSEYGVGRRESGIPRDDLLHGTRRVRRPARQKIRRPKPPQLTDVEIRIEEECSLDCFDAVLERPRKDQYIAEPAVGFRVARIDFDRALEFVDRLLVLAELQVDHTQQGVGSATGSVETDGGGRKILNPLQCLDRLIRPADEKGPEIGVGEPHVRSGVTGIDVDRVLE